MKNAFVSFLLGFVCTATFFLLCLFLVVGAKIVLNAVKVRFFKPREPMPEPIKRTTKKRKRKPQSTTSPVRSIEIDPEQIDRIYVKKIS